MDTRHGLSCLVGMIFGISLAASAVDIPSGFVPSVQETKISSSPGRHVCTTQKTIGTPVPVVQTYRKPVYTPRDRDCPNLTNCPQYDVTYVLTNRTIFQLQKSTTFEYSCCPGWTKGQKRDKGCPSPICSNGCGDFGVCVKPDVCECQTGYSGPMCDTDIDECQTKDHGCQQLCKNTAGSYICACQEGFILGKDGKMCNFCFTCQKEYKDLLAAITALENREVNISHDKTAVDELNVKLNTEVAKLREEIRILTLEKDENAAYKKDMEDILVSLKIEVMNLTKVTESQDQEQIALVDIVNSLMKRVTTLEEENEFLRTVGTSFDTKFDTLMLEIEALKNLTFVPPTPEPTTTSTSPTTTRTTTPLTTTTTPPPTTANGGYGYDTYDLIISLSNQIGLMEEKLHLCQCEARGRG